jgi:tetratricopeptide (TPR) repeat protein
VKAQRPAPRLAEPAPLAIDRDELEKAVGRQGTMRLERKLREAARAFEADRLDEAQPRLRRLVAEAPSLAPARELYGLALYRLGKWALALRELEAFAALTSSTEQHPVMADCSRALRRWDDVERLWTELRAASPSAELVTEGRIVMAGALADQGDLAGAIDLLSRAFDPPQRPKDFHLRRMYALADLYERAGELPKARELFRRIAAADPDFFDVTDRVRSLG